MTDRSRKLFTTLLPSLCVASLLVSCGRMPEEGEVVIRAEDMPFAGDDTLRSITDGTGLDSIPADTLPHPDSLVRITDPLLTLPDSLSVLADSLVIADSLAADTVEVEVVSGECPWNVLAIEVHGSIYSSLQGECEAPDILGAHIVRCMWWDTDPWAGMNAGDSIYAVWGATATGRENMVLALRYVPVEGTANHAFSVYTFRMTGDNYPSLYYADGLEVMRLLDVMPIGTFEEMTGPFGEPRGNHSHAGVDFKAPEGTPVRTCRGGTVVRTNWNSDYNGNCVEVAFGGGYSEIFLHLSAIAPGVVSGAVLEPGAQIGSVGNTGLTSTNHHLHYQINDSNADPIDPYTFSGSHRRSLPQGDMEAFGELRDMCDRWMDGASDI